MKIVSSFWLLLFCMIPLLVMGEERRPDSSVVMDAGIKQHVDFLAHPDRQGRTRDGKRESANYIINWFKQHDVKPFFEKSYVAPVPDLGDDSDRPVIVGKNLGGFIEGTDPQLKNEFIIINAHYDHLGMKNGVIYPGADDNASGVSMMLELSRIIAKKPLKRSVAFVAFDLEEYLLWGSRWFMAHPPIDQERIKLCITADMIGRSLGGLDIPTVFVMGSEHSPQLQEMLDATKVPEELEVARLGIDIIGTRSDYGPFRDQEIPFLFFSTGEHPDYHKPTDKPEKIDAAKTARISNLILSIVQQAGTRPNAPEWIMPKESYLAEATAINRVTQHLLDANQQGEVKLSSVQRFFVSQVSSKTKYMITNQKVSTEERAWLVRATQLLMLSVF